MGLPLVTKAEYKAYKGYSSTTSDGIIDSLIPKVSDLVKAICRRSFIDHVSTPKVEYSEGGSTTIELEETPVIAVSSVWYSSDYGQTYSQLNEFIDYAFSKRNSNLVPLFSKAPIVESNSLYGYIPYGSSNDRVFPEAINGYRITYTAGYQVLPEDLKLAIFDLIAFYIKNDSAIHSSKAISPNTMQIEYVSSTNFPAHIKRILDLYTTSYN